MESTPVKAAKSLRSNFWFVRSDGSEEFLRQKCGDLAKWIDVKAVLAVYHVGGSKENPHAHACIELTSSPQKQSFDKRFKALFGVEKRSQFSTKPWDGDIAAAAYMFHEAEAPILVNKGWTEERLAAAKAHNEMVQKVVAVNNERASTKLVDRAVEHFATSGASRFEILRYMLDECREGRAYYPGTFQLKKYVEEVQLKLTTTEDFDQFVAELQSQMWKTF